MDLEDDLKKVLTSNLKEADILCVAAGSQISIPFQSTLTEWYITEQNGFKKTDLHTILTVLGKQLQLSIRLHWYFIEYRYFYQLIVSAAPDEDADGMEFVTEIPRPAPLALAATVGFRQ